MISFLAFLKVVSIAFATLYGIKLSQVITQSMRHKQLCQELGHKDLITEEELVNDMIVFGFTFALLVAISVAFIAIT